LESAAINADGWMHSGDPAVMDEDDYLQIVGRINDMIIRGGENIPATGNRRRRRHDIAGMIQQCRPRKIAIVQLGLHREPH
jgi:hypothetical protein